MIRTCLLLALTFAASASGAPSVRVTLQRADTDAILYAGQPAASRLIVQNTSDQAASLEAVIEIVSAADGRMIQSQRVPADFAAGASKEWPLECRLEPGIYSARVTVRAATGAVLDEQRTELRIFPPPPQTRPAFSVQASPLSPFILVRNRGPRTILFQGLAAADLAGPSHVAYVDNHKVKVAPLSGPIDVSNMTESWMVFFYAASRGWEKIPAPYRMDVPIFVVLQKMPSEVKASPDGVEFIFPAESGVIALCPLFGTSIVKAERTQGWLKEFPKEVFDRCRLMAEISREFPIRLHEQFKVFPVADKLIVRDRVDFASIDDDWKTPHRKIAPLEYPTTLAARAKFRLLSIQGTLSDLVYPAASGAFGGVEADDVSFTLTGLLRYINQVEQPANPPASNAGQRLGELVQQIAGDELVYRLDALSGRMHAAPASAAADPWAGAELRAARFVHDFYVASVDSADFNAAKKHWPILRAMYDLASPSAWGASGMPIGGAEAIDARLAASIAFARLAFRVGDDDGYRLASYHAARQLLAMWAAGVAYPQFSAENDLWPAVFKADRKLAFSDLRAGNQGLAPGAVFGFHIEPQFRFVKDRMPDYLKRIGNTAQPPGQWQAKTIALWQGSPAPQPDEAFHEGIAAESGLFEPSPVFILTRKSGPTELGWDLPGVRINFGLIRPGE